MNSNARAVTLAIISLPIVVVLGAVLQLSATVTGIAAAAIAFAIFYAGSRD
jgi:1,4-dihydroxy-2-naphthoate octaprenyltransferase